MVGSWRTARWPQRNILLYLEEGIMQSPYWLDLLYSRLSLFRADPDPTKPLILQPHLAADGAVQCGSVALLEARQQGRNDDDGRLRRWQRDGTWPRPWTILAAGQAGSRPTAAVRLGKALLAAAPVAAPGVGPMAATPPRPPQHLPHPRASNSPTRPAAAASPRSIPDQVRAGVIAADLVYLLSS
jgi:hypothetical protein